MREATCARTKTSKVPTRVALLYLLIFLFLIIHINDLKESLSVAITDKIFQFESVITGEIFLVYLNVFVESQCIGGFQE